MGPSRILELHELQESFQSLLLQANPNHIAAFFYWLDLQVAQFKIFGSCLTTRENGTPSQARKRLFASDLQLGNGAYSPSHGRSVLLDGSAGGSLLQDRNGVCNGSGGSVINNSLPAGVAQAPRNANDRAVVSSASPLEDLYGLSKQQVCENQMVKSLLRAMLAKSSSDCTDAAEPLVKHERHIDSGSENVSETAACAVQMRDDEDDRSGTGSLVIDDNDATSMKYETESATLQNGSFAHNESSEGTPGSTEKSSRCPYCLKIFRYRSSYRRHVKIHEGIFSHSCSVCQRKFTRKEHFVRHKCDRRANKPYHLSHFEFHRERKSSSKSSASRNGENYGTTSEGVTSFGDIPEQSGYTSDIPLELTSQSAGKWDPTKVRSVGEFGVPSSTGSPAVNLVNDRAYKPGVRDFGDIPEQGGFASNVPLELTCQSAVKWDPTKSRSTGEFGFFSSSGSPANDRVSKPDVEDFDQLEGGTDSNASDCLLLQHGEKRRKSSTPRKVISLGEEQKINTDGCFIDYSMKREKFEGLKFDISHPVH